MLNEETQRPEQSFNELTANTTSDWLMEAVLEKPDGEFEAYICTKRGNYLLGTFKTKAEAEQANTDAKEARWNG